MHLIPESSTSTMASTLNELECIYQLSKVLPVHWKIVVKLNPLMLTGVDTHPNNYYKTINRIPSVYFIEPTFSSLKIIQQSEAVATLSGTSLLEAVIYDKPAFCWGKPEFNIIDGIYQFNEESFWENFSKPINKTKLNHYVQYCLEEGIDFDFDKLISVIDITDKDFYVQTIDKIYSKLTK